MLRPVPAALVRATVVLVSTAAVLAEGQRLRRVTGSGAAPDRPLRIAGSSTVLPVARAWDQRLSGGGGVPAVISGGGSGDGVKRLCAPREHPDHVDIGDMSRDWRPHEAVALDDGYTFECVDSGIRVTQIAIGLDGITIVLQPGGDAHTCLTSTHRGGLTLAQLRWAFFGESEEVLAERGVVMASVAPSDDHDGLREWSDLDPSCAHRPIHVYGAGNISGTRDMFAHAIFGAGGDTSPFAECGADEVAAFEAWALEGADAARMPQRSNQNCFLPSENDSMIVAWTAADPHAIAFVGHGYHTVNSEILTTAKVASDRRHGARDTRDAMVAPTTANIVDGSYEVFTRRLYMNVDNEAWDVAAPFMEYGLSKPGQDDVDGLGFVHLNSAILARMLSRVAQRGNENARHVPTSTTTESQQTRGPVGHDFDQLLTVVGVVAFFFVCMTILVVLITLWVKRLRGQSEASADPQGVMGITWSEGDVAAATLLPALCDDVIYLNSDLCICSPCPRLASMLALPVAELEGEPFLKLMSEEDGTRFLGHIGQMQAQAKDAGLAASLNIHILGGERAEIAFQCFVGRNTSGDAVLSPKRCMYAIGLCQLQEQLLSGDSFYAPPNVDSPTDLRPSDLAEVASSISDGTSITAIFGQLDVCFDCLSGEFRIASCSRAWLALAGQNAVGSDLTDWIVERSKFTLWAQARINAYLETADPEESFAPECKLTLKAPFRRRLRVTCRMRHSGWQSEDSTPSSDGGGKDSPLLLTAVFDNVEWEASGSLAAKRPGGCAAAAAVDDCGPRTPSTIAAPMPAALSL